MGFTYQLIQSVAKLFISTRDKAFVNLACLRVETRKLADNGTGLATTETDETGNTDNVGVIGLKQLIGLAL